MGFRDENIQIYKGADRLRNVAYSERVCGRQGFHAGTVTSDGGKIQLLAGDYTVQWEGGGPDVELTINRHKKVKATVPAKLVPENSAFDQNATIIRVESDGSRKLTAIRLSGKRFTLQNRTANRRGRCREERSRGLVKRAISRPIPAQ